MFKRRNFLDKKDPASKRQNTEKQATEKQNNVASLSVPEKHIHSGKDLAQEGRREEVYEKEAATPERDEPVIPSRFMRLNKAKNAGSSQKEIPHSPSYQDTPKFVDKSWGFDDFLHTDDLKLTSLDQSAADQSDVNPIKDQNSGVWVARSCPKCKKKSIVASSSSGVFLCLNCSFHGDISQPPKSYRSSWLANMELYLTSGAKTGRPEKFQDAPFDLILALGWDGDELKPAWYFPVADESNHLKDALFSFDLVSGLSLGNFTWRRLSLPAYPYGLANLSSQRVVMVADPDDYYSLTKSGVTNIVILPPDLDKNLPTSDAWHMMDFMEAKLSLVSEIVLALPKTSKWRDNEEELGRRFDKERCFRIRLSVDSTDDEVIEQSSDAMETCETESLETKNSEQHFGREYQTVSEAFNDLGALALQTLIDTAHPFPVAGIHELEEIDDQFEILYETGLSPGAATGWPSMDTHYTVKPGQWTVVTGIPGHGKSSWLDALLVNLASMHGWRFGMFSPENQPIERHFASLMEKKLKKPFSKGPTPRISPAEKDKTKKWLNDKFKIILPTDDGLWTLESVLKLARILVYRYGIRGLVIDPWNELDHSVRPNQNETTYISECLTKVRRFARLYDVHVWVVAHPTKLEKKSDQKYPVATPYDISGGAHWRNKADNAISVYRNVNEPDDDVSDVYVQKIRFKEIGSLGRVSLRSDRASGYYIDDIDQHKRELCLEKNHAHVSTQMRIPAPRQYPSGPPLEYENEF